MAEILNRVERRPATAPLYVRQRPQPSLRDLISGILRRCKTPMSVSEIYKATLATRYHWRSQDPINALNVKMYTDKTFKKVSPGRFTIRKP